jgi:hypothetical protein
MRITCGKAAFLQLTWEDGPFEEKLGQRAQALSEYDSSQLAPGLAVEKFQG